MVENTWTGPGPVRKPGLRSCACPGKVGGVLSVYCVVRLTLSTPTSIGPMLFTAAMRRTTRLPAKFASRPDKSAVTVKFRVFGSLGWVWKMF